MMSQVDDQGRRTNEINDIPTARADGGMVDDGNEPTTENSPVANASDTDIMKQWEHSGSCFRRMEGGQNLSPNLALPRELENPSILHVFEYIKDVLLVATNHQLEGEEVTYGEFLALPRELENPSILHVF
jgi:hypothetical protein